MYSSRIWPIVSTIYYQMTLWKFCTPRDVMSVQLSGRSMFQLVRGLCGRCRGSAERLVWCKLELQHQGPSCRLIHRRPSVFDRFPCGEVDVDLCYWGDAYLPSTWFETSKWRRFSTYLYCLCAECALLLDASVCFYLLEDSQVNCNLLNVMWRLTWHINWNTAKHWLMFSTYCVHYLVLLVEPVFTFLKKWLIHVKSGELHSDASATYVIYSTYVIYC